MEPTAVATPMEGITTAFSTALTSISGDVFDMIKVALPIALGIVGVFIATKLGIRFFKTVSGGKS